MRNYFLVSAVVLSGLMVVGAGCSTVSNTSADSVMKKDEGVMMDEPQKNEPTMEKQDTMKQDDSAMMKTSGQYIAYEPSKLALAANGPVVLFFHAGWCPTCKAADTDINSNLSTIPANTTILKVDYDTNPDLKKKYGVTYQHTFVQVDVNGTMIKKWSGGNTLASIVSQIK